MSIKSRIIIILSFMVLLLLGVTFYGRYNTNHAVSLLLDVSLVNAQKQTLITDIQHHMATNRSQILLAMQHNPSFEFSSTHDHPTDLHIKTIEKMGGEIRALWKQYYDNLTDPNEKRLAEDWYNKSGELGIQGITATVNDIKAGKWADAQRLLLGKIASDYRAGETTATALDNYLGEKTKTANQDVMANISLSGYIMLACAAFSVLVAILASISVVRRVIIPLESAVRLADRVASGDLTGTIAVESQDEIGKLMQSLRSMNDSLVNIISSVRQETTAIASASVEIAQGNLDLSARTEGQASALEQTASSMTEITSTVRQTSENASEANSLASTAAETADASGRAIAHIVETMKAIESSADKIVNIISVIDGIAFQTNILALNASVEAARAGEQGRGFAVVASEVRSLAQRSATAAREIKTLIDDSVQNVRAGSVQVDKSMSTINDLVNSIRHVYNIITEINHATHEQVAGIEQINQAIAQMDNMTQQNANLVEEVASATQSLRDNAQELSEAVSFFTLTQGSMRSSPPALPSPDSEEAPAA